MEDSSIIELYFSRSDEAIAQTDAKYGAYARTIAKNILKNKEDAEEALNDTYLRLWNTIPPKRPDSLKAYVASLCRSSALDVYDKLKAQKRISDYESSLAIDELLECFPACDDEDASEALSLREALNAFLSELDPKSRQIFMRRYFFANSQNKIATDFSMTKSAVSMSLSRTREKLKSFLEKEGFSI